MNKLLVGTTIGLAVLAAAAGIVLYVTNVFDSASKETADESVEPVEPTQTDAPTVQTTPADVIVSPATTQDDWVAVTVGAELFPFNEPETNFTEAVEVDDPGEIYALDIEVVDRKPCGVNIHLQAGSPMEPDIYWWPVPANVGDIDKIERAMQNVGLTYESVPKPWTFTPDVLAVTSKLILCANGYFVELLCFMEYVINGRFEEGDVVLERVTGHTLEHLVGTDAYSRVRTWGRAPTSRSLIGNMNVIYEWLRHCSGLKVQEVNKMTLRDLAGYLSVCKNPPRDIRRTTQHLMRFLSGAEVRIYTFIDNYRNNILTSNTARSLRNSGVRDGGVFDYYGKDIETFQVSELVHNLRTLGKFAASDPKFIEILENHTSKK